MSECIFCKILSGTIPAALVYEDDAGRSRSTMSIPRRRRIRSSSPENMWPRWPNFKIRMSGYSGI